MPALEPCLIIEPIWQQLLALLPERHTNHPLGCHRPRIPERVVFEKLVQVLVFGLSLRKDSRPLVLGHHSKAQARREWIELGVLEALGEMALEAYDRMVGLEPSEVVVDSCITKAPCAGEKAGRNPVDRGKEGIKRSVVVDGKGIPLGSVSAPANRHDSPLLAPTLDAARALGLVAQGASVRLDRGYDSDLLPASECWSAGSWRRSPSREGQRPSTRQGDGS